MSFIHNCGGCGREYACGCEPNALLPTEEVERVARAIEAAMCEDADRSVGCIWADERGRGQMLLAARTAMRALAKPDEGVVLHFVFDGPPGPDAGRFVECETPDGRSVNAGEWHERTDGLWELRVALGTPRPHQTASSAKEGILRAMKALESIDRICAETTTSLSDNAGVR